MSLISTQNIEHTSIPRPTHRKTSTEPVTHSLHNTISVFSNSNSMTVHVYLTKLHQEDASLRLLSKSDL